MTMCFSMAWPRWSNFDSGGFRVGLGATGNPAGLVNPLAGADPWRVTRGPTISGRGPCRSGRGAGGREDLGGGLRGARIGAGLPRSPPLPINGKPECAKGP